MAKYDIYSRGANGVIICKRLICKSDLDAQETAQGDVLLTSEAEVWDGDWCVAKVVRLVHLAAARV